MATLKIWFRGTCSHFANIAPGIPHRVVLPDASAFQLGMIDVDNHVSLPYYIMPHFAVVRSANALHEELLNVERVMEHGNIFDGVRLQIANAVGNHIEYENSYFGVSRLVDFVPDYVFADEVVLGGRAVCYFDLFNGTIEKATFPEDNGVSAVLATLETVGDPILLATPFFQTTTALAPVSLITLPATNGEVELVVANRGIDCDSEDDKFDFLLHYLTKKGGIPRLLSQRVPGMPPAPEAIATFTQTDLDEALAHLSQVDFPNHFTTTCFGNFLSFLVGVVFDVTAACSDTRYP